jgi:hypothetical protein
LVSVESNGYPQSPIPCAWSALRSRMGLSAPPDRKLQTVSRPRCLGGRRSTLSLADFLNWKLEPGNRRRVALSPTRGSLPPEWLLAANGRAAP